MRIKLTLTKENLSEFAFYIFMFYFFCLDYVYIVFPGLNSIINSKVLGIAVLVIAILMLLREINFIPARVILLYFMALFFIMISMIISDDNIAYILDSILTMNNVKQILLLPLCVYMTNDVYNFNSRMYKFSIFALFYYMIIYGLYFINANVEGGFYGTYGMLLGFQSTFFWLFILQHGFLKRSVFDFVFSVFTGLLIVSFGSRSVILVMCIAVVAYLYCYVGIENRKKKIAIVLSILTLGIVFYVYFDTVLQILIKLLSRFSNMGRTLSVLKNSEWLFDSDGRDEIWGTCIEEIIKNPLAVRGIGGDVRILTNSLGTGYYAHNFVLEILLEFGILIGAIVIFMYLRMIFRTFCIHNTEIKTALLPFAVMTVTVLFFSLTCWTCPWLWMYIVLYLCWGEKQYRLLNMRIKIRR